MPLTEEQITAYNQIVAIIEEEDTDNADAIEDILKDRTDALTIIDRRKDDTEKGDTLLMLAIRKEKANIVNYLIDKGADTTLVNSDKENALLFAIGLEFRIDIINKLYEKETDINRRGFKSVPLLVYAIHHSRSTNSYFDLIKELLEKGAKFDSRGPIIRFSIEYGETIETRESALMCAINNTEFTQEQLLYLISKLTDASTIDLQSRPQGYTALMFVILREDLDIPSRIALINKLLEFNPNVNLKNVNNESAVTMVAKVINVMEENMSLSVPKNQLLFSQVFTLFRELYRRADATTREEATRFVGPDSYRKSKTGNSVNYKSEHIRLRIGYKMVIEEGLERILTIPKKYEDNVKEYNIIETFITPISDICTKILEEYRRRSIRNSNLIIAYYTIEEGKSDDEKLLGFITAEYRPKRFIYIDLICTNYRYKGVGKQLLQVVKDIAKESEIPKITLKSVLPSVPFYSYQGFNVNTEKLDIDLLPMKYNMSKYTGGRRRKTKRRITKPKKCRSNTRRR